MRFALIFLLLFGCLQFAAGAAGMAAGYQNSGDRHAADLVGLTGCGIALAIFIAGTIWIWIAGRKWR